VTDPVRYTIWDPDALEMYDRASLTHQQRVLVEGLLRSLEAGTYLSEHVSAAKSVVLALTRSHHALDGHARLKQPQIGLTRAVLSRALSDVASAVSAFTTTPTGTAMISQAQQILSQVNTSMAGTPSSTDKQQLANRIGALVQPGVRAARSLFEAIWNGVDVTAEVASHIRDEVAVLVALEGRDGLALRVELFRLLSRGAVDSAAVADVLWPAHRQYRVAVVVSGTRVLEGLDQLLPGAQQWPLIDRKPPAGIPYIETRKLIDSTLNSVGSSTLIVLPTWASDAYTAIAQARRDVVETLDQYAAGQRLLELTIDPRSVAIAPSNEPFTFNPRIGGEKVARPLTSHWPAPLRSALRMANLAGRMDAPVASVMLAWSAIESMEVKSSDIELIAQACALHSLRQQILSVYKSVTDSANARLRLARWRVSRAQAVLGKAERGHARVARSNSPAAQEAASRLEIWLVQVRAQLAEVESSRTQLEQSLLPSIEIIRRNLLGGGDVGNPLNLSSWLLDVNDFLDAILPLDATSSADLWQSQNAVAVLAKGAGGLAEERLYMWQRRLADPSSLADWLNDQQNIFHGLLAWMYVSRNLAIHTGRFAVPADLLTAQAGRSIVDMLLEFLGHWYQDQRSRGVPDSDVRAVLEELGHRKDILENHLRNSESCHPLNVSTITAPDTDCWNRV
jgi:hypothetical protein